MLSYQDKFNTLTIGSIVMSLVDGKKNVYNVECVINGRDFWFIYNKKLQEVVSCSITQSGYAGEFGYLGDNYIYVIHCAMERLLKESK